MAGAVCPACGSESESDSRFCRYCGTVLAPQPDGADARKIVTVLFIDVAGSTLLAERLDPESLRQLMTRYFEVTKAVLEHHGGTAEKFIGDAVMAVFGVPRLHEDDALRAVRAAEGIRRAHRSLNEELERTWGVRIHTRTGLNTGEVITADPRRGQSFVAADAVNLAARLQEAAEPGEVLIGESTFRLVTNAVTAEPVPPLTVKGKAETLRAWKLLDVADEAPGWARRLDSPLMGRSRELEFLQEVLHRSINAQACELTTLMGSAGVGKSRLASEFLSRVGGRVRVIRGRCLPYGEGITFWPVVEVVKDAGCIGELDSPEQARRKLFQLIEGRMDSSLIGERLAALMGLSDATSRIQETFWTVRRVFEALAARQPLVVVFDDIHSGEATFLDLLEYLVDWVRHVPLMLLCLARPELLEVRGTWLTGKANASLLKLQPLTQPETEGLLHNLLGGAELGEDARFRIVDIAEGNPLFIEETLRMLVDGDQLQRTNGSWHMVGASGDLTIPPTIHAVLAARLDRLDREERALIERASVVGRVFWWEAVSQLSPEEQRPRVGGHLQSLVRKELLRPDPSDRNQEDAFRFTHILIRDAAYSGIPKATRADLHEQFADWIETKSQGVAGEYEEIVGYHLEQAFLTLSDLAPRNARSETLARRAAVPLASAGRRAFARGDMPAAVNLLARAEALYGKEDRARLELLPDLAFALEEVGNFPRLREVVAETSEVAQSSGDAGLQAHALMLSLWTGVSTEPEGWVEQGHREATRAISLFDDEGDERGLARGWSLLGLLYTYTCRFGSAEEALHKAAAYAHAAGNQREELEYLSWIPFAVWGGPTPVPEAIQECRDILRRAAGDRKTMSTALFTRAKLEAMAGRFDDARDLIAEARSTLEEVALPVWMAGPLAQMCGWVELLAGDPASAEQHLRSGMEALREMGELSWMSTVSAILAEAVHLQGRFDEAEQLTRVSEDMAGSEDAYSQSLLRSVRAKALSRRGDTEVAVPLGREAVAITAGTDSSFLQAFALTSLGEVLRVAGSSEADACFAEAVTVCDRKGHVVGAERARTLLLEETLG